MKLYVPLGILLMFLAHCSAKTCAITTPDQYKYFWIIDCDVSINLTTSNSTQFWFRGSNDIHVLLAEHEHNEVDDVVEVVIGGWDNSQSVIRTMKQGNHIAQISTPNILSDSEFREFWITWTNGYLKVGKGGTIGQNLVMEWNDGTINVKYIGISTGWGCIGNWKFEVEDGHWASWSGWGSCSKSCGTGSQQRTRSCTDPPPKNGGKVCSGSPNKTQPCNTHGCPVDGVWTAFSAWSLCTVTCGGGTMRRSRSCTNPAPQNNGADCPGSETESQHCNDNYCPIDGGWTTWSSYSSCSLTCGTGKKTRTRSCSNPSPQHNGQDCSGASTEDAACGTGACPVDGNWATWASWATCSVTCGGGTQDRTRSCSDPPMQHGGADCVGDASETQACNTQNCPIDGGWSSWSAYTSCSLTCGSTGTKSRTRTCDNPPAQYNGAACSGDTTDVTACNRTPCPIDGGFTGWTAWDTCFVTCGGGTQDRRRTCTDPSPAHGGANCSGAYSETQSCNTHYCPIDGQWSAWTSWSSCPVTCGTSTISRSRNCDNPPAQYLGQPCPGSDSETTTCNPPYGPCPIDGGFTTWTSWDTCTVTCAGGTQNRTRSCTNPPTQYGGAPCVGQTDEQQTCNTQNCPTKTCAITTPDQYKYFWIIDCDVSINLTTSNSTQFWFRGSNDVHVLLAEHEHNEVDDVVEVVIGGWDNSQSVIRTMKQGNHIAQISTPNILSDSEFREFWITWTNGYLKVGKGGTIGQNLVMEWNDGTINVKYIGISTGWGCIGNWKFEVEDGHWASWSGWGSCSKSCGTGSQQRTRSCTDPPPKNGGKVCSGSPNKTQPCNTHGCPVDGVWTAFSAWSLCTVTCGGGTMRRSRSCTNPAPQNNGADCPGSATESQHCNDNYCPIDGGFSTWTAWSMCTVTCGGGTQARTRSCDNPQAQHGGADCVGNRQESQTCNTHYCPIDGVWSDWGSWSSCGITCGTSIVSRSRNCDNPTPQYNGADCPGSDSETQSCSAAYGPCPIDGVFTTWTSWSTCTETCAGGTQDRGRSCTNPPPAYGGANCTGDYSQRQCCNSQHCPIDGGFSLWSDWTDCSSTCGHGTSTRTRTCTNPQAQYNGLPCSGSTAESTVCNGTCLVDGEWSFWKSWTTCTATCNGGIQTRVRACDNPPPTLGGFPCLGDELEIQPCNEQSCPGFLVGGGGSEGGYVNKCGAGFFTCRGGEIKCIVELFKCDCSDDCSDGSDELTNWASCEVECHDSATAVQMTRSAVIGSLLLLTILTSW